MLCERGGGGLSCRWQNSFYGRNRQGALAAGDGFAVDLPKGGELFN